MFLKHKTPIMPMVATNHLFPVMHTSPANKTHTFLIYPLNIVTGIIDTNNVCGGVVTGVIDTNTIEDIVFSYVVCPDAGQTALDWIQAYHAYCDCGSDVTYLINFQEEGDDGDVESVWKYDVAEERLTFISLTI